MMVALHDVQGERHDNENANYTSIDAIAYLNNIGLRIYQPHRDGLRLAHQFIPEHATEISYLYHEGIHFQALMLAPLREEMKPASPPVQMNPEITFSAHQKIFHAKLEKIKRSITHFPSVFIAYGWGDDEHGSLVAGLNEDLKRVGFKTAYDLDVRLGGKDNIHTHANKILTVDKVIIVGSSELKAKYDEEEGMITEEIDLLRTRVRKKRGSKLPTGVIPIWFSGTIEESFPEELLHLPVRPVTKKSLTDTNYFEKFFEVLMDIFHTEKQGEEIIRKIQKKKESFIRQSKIPEETLKRYGEKYLEEMQVRAEKDQRKRESILLSTDANPKKRSLQKRIGEEDQATSNEGHPIDAVVSHKKKLTRDIQNQLEVTGFQTHICSERGERELVQVERTRDLTQWVPRFEEVSLGYLPEFDQKSFIESISEGFEESYLVQLGNKLHQSGSHKQTKLLITGDRKKVAVTGLGGIGKTSLALAYAHLCSARHLYEVIHWIPAEEQSLIILSYRRLLQSLNESVKNLDDDEVRIRLNHVIKDKKYLLIFDNINSPGELKDNLKQDLLPQGHKGHIIVTSRYHSSGWDESIEMDVFSDEEAINYLFKRINAQRIIQEESEDNKSIARKVAKKLGCLPLALSQAASYIQVRECSLNDYLNKLKTQNPMLFKFQDEKTRKKPGAKTKTKKDLDSIVYTTWNMTLDELDPFARQLMTYFSYLSPDDIPISLFKDTLIDEDEEEIEDIIDDLKRYSMIKRSGDYISLHRLVQRVGRIQQKEKKQEKEVIEKLMGLFVDKAEVLFEDGVYGSEKEDLILSYLPHVAKLYNYVESLTNINEELLGKLGCAGLMLFRLGEDIHYYVFQRLSTKIGKYKATIHREKIQHMLKKGAEIFKNKKSNKGLQWLESVVENNDAIIQNHLGDMYHYGEGISQDYTKAREWYEKSAEQGHPFAQFSLGEMYEEGKGGLKRDEVKAREWYEKAALEGDTSAQYKLGWMYELGEGGLSRDEFKAREWYEKSAEQGHPFAQFSLGEMYEEGKGGLKRDEVKARELYEKAAEQEYPFAQFNLGVMYEEGKGGLERDEVKARELYEKAALDDPFAQFKLGEMYEEGKGGLERDEVKARELYEKAAEQEYPFAQFKLGEMYEEGKGGLERDEVKARELYEKAALDDPFAQFKLGEMYEEGRGGLLQDDAEAVKWYRLAADQGDTDAQEKLSLLYGSEEEEEEEEVD